ncbi:SLC13 family permease [Brotaphodocola sp.]|uniref:SLC13 family permease n=1 Tax=Brotaphodocola sp. TaxID=3073577 RepID=UPI003D7C68BB
MSVLTICLIIFLLTVIGYCLNLYSLATISMISMVALVLTGCLSPNDALAYFSNNNIIMIAGMCIVAAGFNRTQFCSNMANGIAKISKGSLKKMMLGYVLIGTILSQFIQSPAVVFGIVAPMLQASAESMGVKPSKVMFPLGVATVITCCTLPLGAGATIASELNGYIESYGYMAHTVGIMDPMKGRLPLLIIAVLYCAFISPKFAPDEPVIPTIESAQTAQKREKLPVFQEYAGIILFFGDALALMFASRLGLPNWLICVTGALLMIVFGVLKPREATASIPMSMLLLIVGALAMSGALSATGAGELIGSHISAIVNAVNGNSYIVGLIFFIVPFVLTQFMQNRGVMLIFHPIAIATCASIGANPVGLMILIQSACLSAFMTPMATSAIPYIMEYGGYDQKSMIKQSWFLSLICCVVSVGWIMTVFPL